MQIIKENMISIWYKGLANFYKLTGAVEKSKYLLEKVILETTPKAKDWWRLGQAYSSLGQWDKASQAFRKASQLQQEPDYIYWLGTAEERLGNDDEALVFYEQVLEVKSNLYQALWAKGQILMRKGQIRAALENFLRVWKVRGDLALLNDIGYCYLLLDDVNSALKYLVQAVGKRPYDKTILFNYGIALIKNQDYHKAALTLEGINNKDDTHLLIALAHCYAHLENWPQSVNYYLKALELEPENSETMLNLAAAYAKNNQVYKSLEIYKSLSVRNPQDSQLLNNMAWSYELLENFAEAEQYYYRGLALAPHNSEIIYNLACCLKKQGKVWEAIDILEPLKKVEQWSRIAWTMLAQIYEQINEKSLAVDCYNKALGLE